MAKKIIHVNRNLIGQNKDRPRDKHFPVFSVKEGSKNTYCYGVKFLGPCEMVYKPDEPLDCGARVWIETMHDIELTDPMTWEEAQALK